MFGLGSNIPVNSRSFSGTDPSPLTSLLRKNGYKIQAGYSDTYLGFNGTYIDDYYIGGFLLFGHPVCLQKLLGFCTLISSNIYRKFDEFINQTSRQKLPKEAEGSWSDSVIHLIQRMETSADSPIFSAFHINNPGHTPLDYLHDNKEMYDDYRNHFVSATNEVRVILTKLSQLRLEFPDSIFIVSGDHGPFLFWNPTDTANPPRTRVLDHHHVALALINEHNLCLQSREWLEKNNNI